MANISKHEMLASDLIMSRLYSDVNTLDPESCWLWKRATVKDGYGVMRRKIDKKPFTIFVHRLSWFSQYGEIPDGAVIDHTCHNPAECQDGRNCQHRRCINPNHLKLSTFKENLAKGSAVRGNVGMCKNNLHPWTADNVKVWKSGKRVCASCHYETTKRNSKKVGSRA